MNVKERQNDKVRGRGESKRKKRKDRGERKEKKMTIKKCTESRRTERKKK